MLEQRHIGDLTPAELTNLLKSLVGLDRDQALTLIVKEGFRPRILSVEGSPIPPQYNFDDTRINIDMIRGRVTKAYPG